MGKWGYNPTETDRGYFPRFRTGDGANLVFISLDCKSNQCTYLKANGQEFAMNCFHLNIIEQVD